MKKMTMVVMALVMVVFSASFALASGSYDDINIDIGIDNKNTNTNTATANATANANQTQEQQQQQQQQQAQDQQQNMNFYNVRQHINALPGTAGEFISAPMSMPGSWIALTCSPLFKSFSLERIRQMESASSSFWGGVEVESVVHIPFDGEADSNPINLIGWDIREGAYASDQLLGEFQCQGEYGTPMGAALGKCLAVAKEKTNTHRVFAAYKMRRDPKNSGFSIGSGVSGAALSGSPDDKAVAIALGGLIGTTRAKVDEAYDWTILALNDGPLTGAGAVSPCAVETPVVPPPVVQKTPCPVPAPPASVTEIQKRISELEQKVRECTRFCFNNLCLRYQLGDAYVDWYICTGDKSRLAEAIKMYEIAERNYLKGHDISANQAEANRILAQVYYNWAGVLYELEGGAKAKDFACLKHLERIPTGFARSK